MNSAISGQFLRLVLVPNRSGIGTTLSWYWYHFVMVPVPIQVVPVPLLHTALIFGILTLLSSNSNTEGIGILIND